MIAHGKKLDGKCAQIGTLAQHRIRIARSKKKHITGLQPLISVLEVLTESQLKIWKSLDQNAYTHSTKDILGQRIEYRLAQFGMGELSKITGHDKKTIQDGIRKLQTVHLIEDALYEAPEANTHLPSTYSLFDTADATALLRGEGYVAWRQKGRGRVLLKTG